MPCSPMDVCVVGAGPAGLTAALYAAKAGARTAVLEAQTAPGRKLLLTGGGRCNLTHAGQVNEILAAFKPKDRFLRHAFHTLSPGLIVAFFQDHGLETYVDPDGCVFPTTGLASDVREVLLDQVRCGGAQILCGARVQGISPGPEGFVVHTQGARISSRTVVLATGGLSFPQTGCTGDGYRMAQDLGHTLTPCRAALVSLVTHDTWPYQLAGLAVQDTAVTTEAQGRKVMERGALVFTHNGISGPAVLNASRHVTDLLPDPQGRVLVWIDWLPGLALDRLEQAIGSLCSAHPRKALSGLLADLVPKRLGTILAHLAGCPEDLQASQVSREYRKRVVQAIKALQVRIKGTGCIEEATITRGGVPLDEIDSKTMQSRPCPGLYLAGEILDIDGPCGGYNLQVAWSTGALAGMSAATR